MSARIVVLAFAAMLLLPGARAEDERRVLYLHSDGTMAPPPASAPVDGGSFAASPAVKAYVLRAGAVLEVPSALVGQSGVHAQLRVDDATVGSVSTPMRLLDLDGATTSIVFDNVERTVPQGAVLSLYLEVTGAVPARGLLGGLLAGAAGHGGAPRLVLRAGDLPAPPPAVTPTPPPPTTTPVVAPPAATQPITNTTTIVYLPATPAAPAADEPEGEPEDQAAANRAALSTTFASAMPHVPPTAMLMLMLLATAALGLVTVFRLGRR